MNIFRINNKYVAVAIFLMLAVTLRAQDYGALQYMLQKRPANEKFESLSVDSLIDYLGGHKWNEDLHEDLCRRKYRCEY